MPQFVHEGVASHFEVWEEGESTSMPLILLHGFMQSGSTWDTVALQLSIKRPVVTFDFVGHGQSDCPDDPLFYRMESVVETLNAFLDHLHDHWFKESKQFAVLGYSMGGRIALSFALEHPDHIKSLILESAGLGPQTFEQQQAFEQRDAFLVERLESSTLQEFVDYWEGLPLFATQKNLPPAVQGKIRKGRLQNNLKALKLTVQGTGQHVMRDLSQQVANLPFPLLYIAGTQDENYADLARSFERNLAYSFEANFEANSSVSSALIDAGHNTHLENGESFCRHVDKFLGAE